MMYSDGVGVAQNKSKGQEWLKEAAKSGCENAQSVLDMMNAKHKRYEQGIMVGDYVEFGRYYGEPIHIFTYNAFKMPISSKALLKPKDVKTVDNSVSKPIPENGDEYISDPVSILKKITPRTAKYERKMFEQTVPSYNVLPFAADGKQIIFTGTREDTKIHLYVFGENKVTYINEVLSIGNSFTLEKVPQGKWKAQLEIKYGSIIDSYYFNIEKGAEAFITDTVYRYTYLRVNPNFQSDRKEFETLYKSNNLIEGSNFLPIKISPQKDNNGKFCFKVDLLENLPIKMYLQVGFNSSQVPITVNVSKRVFGKSQPITYTTPGLFEVGVVYWANIAICSEYGDSNSYRGYIELVNNNYSGYDVKFSGTNQITTVGDIYKILYD